MTVVEKVKERLGLYTTNTAIVSGETFFPDQHIYDAINQALMFVWVDIQGDSKAAQLEVAPNIEKVPLPIDELMIPVQVVGTRGPIAITTYADLLRYAPEWKSAQPRQPDYFVAYTFDTVLAWPKAEAAETLDVWGVGWPPELADSTSTSLGIDKDLEDAVVLWASALLVEDLHPQTAEVMMGAALEALQGYRVNLRNNAARRIDKLRPATARQKGRMGQVRLGRGYF